MSPTSPSACAGPTRAGRGRGTGSPTRSSSSRRIHAKTIWPTSARSPRCSPILATSASTDVRSSSCTARSGTRDRTNSPTCGAPKRNGSASARSTCARSMAGAINCSVRTTSAWMPWLRSHRSTGCCEANETPRSRCVARIAPAIDFVLSGDAEVHAAVQAEANAFASEDWEAVAEAHHRLEELNGYDASARAGRLLHGLGFPAGHARQAGRRISPAAGGCA